MLNALVEKESEDLGDNHAVKCSDLTSCLGNCVGVTDGHEVKWGWLGILNRKAASHVEILKNVGGGDTTERDLEHH